jgi:hypothetical protein
MGLTPSTSTMPTPSDDWSHWSVAAGNWTLAAFVALTFFGFYAARAGQPLLGAILRD